MVVLVGVQVGEDDGGWGRSKERKRKRQGVRLEGSF